MTQSVEVVDSARIFLRSKWRVRWYLERRKSEKFQPCARLKLERAALIAGINFKRVIDCHQRTSTAH